MRENIKIGLVIGLTILLRWCVTFHPYSGRKNPPMHGDYEAQRHWQEITFNLPLNQWYSNTTDNDLQYWGLDYPPLTAYHSLILGNIANDINPDFVKLHDSRGFESSDHKQFMRLSVLITDLIIYVPAIVFYFFYAISEFRSIQENNIFGFKKLHFTILTALAYPGIILIDHGHFQYNSISLGFFLLAVVLIIRKFLSLGSFFFVLALNYKQMELYHALPIFFYILSECTPNRKKSILLCLKSFVSVSLTVIITFSVIWLPFLRNMNFIDVVIRLFPLSRGVFEDKVSNIWCTINIFMKLRKLFDHLQLAKICFFTTVIFSLPSCLDIYLNPSAEKFILSLINSALAFYLFSFQVHEKTILLVAIPVLIYFHYDPLPCFWFLIISTFSLLPLLIKDGLFSAYFSLMIFYGVLIFWIWFDEFNLNTKLKNENFTMRKRTELKEKNQSNLGKKNNLIINNSISNIYFSHFIQLFLELKKTFFYSSIVGIFLLSLVIRFVDPPRRFPDLFPLFISVYSCGHFLLFFVYFNIKQIFTLRSKTKKVKHLSKCE
ncbi:dolichyl pyrophosphate Man9GlcNAc2 alpha-1,3-glucosyltransferase [Microplitis mediator]|uniref:dolichyl pyrophosphate Man9GlcNAc2 alpha-1,3-glucosyltransferase n=1 Tax=Microplitis mediator TaxID=375433 RepID=UPI0025560CE1|nr:dolichyl pyrophosphate Man9GlcNAc2 alpha-1,3-glucosyltransferase [Microplitis mediator]